MKIFSNARSPIVSVNDKHLTSHNDKYVLIFCPAHYVIFSSFSFFFLVGWYHFRSGYDTRRGWLTLDCRPIVLIIIYLAFERGTWLFGRSFARSIFIHIKSIPRILINTDYTIWFMCSTSTSLATNWNQTNIQLTAIDGCSNQNIHYTSHFD